MAQKPVETPLEDGFELAGNEDPMSRFKCDFCGYYVLCVLASGSVSATAVCVWSSSMGVGTSTFAALEEFSWMSKWCFAMCFFVLFILYLLDFFWPPHLPGHLLCLWEGDAIAGRLVLGIAGIFLLSSVLLLTPMYPGIPLVVTTMLCPVSVGVVHLLVRSGETLPKGQLMNEIVEQGDVPAKLRLLRGILGKEHDLLSFFKAVTAAFLTCFAVIFGLWLAIAVQGGKGLEGLEDALDDERDKIYIQWATPLVVAISNLVFALYAFLRVFMQKTYSATDVYRNRLLAETLQSSLHEEILDYRLANAKVEDIEAKKQGYLTQHVQHIKQLSMLVKVVACLFVLVIGALYVVGQLLYANSDIAFMVLGLLGAMFLLFVLFVWVAFSRIVWAMGRWLQDLPVWKAARCVVDWPLTRAFFICPLLPAIPIVLLSSLLNQRVRVCRGLRKAVPRKQLDEEDMLEGDEMEPMSFTPRVAAVLAVVRRWDWLKICHWCYALCGIYVCYTICPLLLNVGLSWLRSITVNWPFAVIVSSTFVIGVVAFLLPPVPGMTIYIFGGLVISGTCPPVNTDRGFWLGTAINMIMCWVLKLVACALQQKCIGGLLGRSMWVRRTVGVHKVAIRCIEAELKTPGLTLGKVAILCGGPDWPTSVIAGVLNLSLLQCELGTVPIIGFVAPCALTGSLYIKKGEGEVWSRSADLMIVVSVVVNLILWAIAFWAIQNRLEADYDELKRHLPENVDLHWFDYRAEQVAKRSLVSWSDIPVSVRSIYLLGAVLQILVCHGLNWAYSKLFGSFQVQDDISTCVFWPTEESDGELFTWLSIVVLSVYFLAFAGALQFIFWRRRHSAGPARQAALELDLLETQWKQDFVRMLQNERHGSSFTSQSTCSLPSQEPKVAEPRLTVEPKLAAELHCHQERSYISVVTTSVPSECEHCPSKERFPPKAHAATSSFGTQGR